MKQAIRRGIFRLLLLGVAGCSQRAATEEPAATPEKNVAFAEDRVPPAMFFPGEPDTGSDLDDEIEAIGQALREHGQMSRQDLSQAVHGRTWGPGRFRSALRDAVVEQRAREVGRGTYAPATPQEARAGSSRA